MVWITQDVVSLLENGKTLAFLAIWLRAAWLVLEHTRRCRNVQEHCQYRVPIHPIKARSDILKSIVVGWIDCKSWYWKSQSKILRCNGHDDIFITSPVYLLPPRFLVPLLLRHIETSSILVSCLKYTYMLDCFQDKTVLSIYIIDELTR